MDIDWRVFYAHPKTDNDDNFDADAALIASMLRSSLKRQGIEGSVTVTTGKRDWDERGRDAGGWRGWPASVTEEVMGDPRYNLIVVAATDTRPAWDDGYTGLRATVGRGTKDIVENAVQRGVPVMLWDTTLREWVKKRTFRQARVILTVNNNDWKTGWEIRG